MSRLGKLPVKVPAGVQASVKEGVISVQGPKGLLTRKVAAGVNVVIKDGEFHVSRTADDAQSRANFGSIRAHVANMVQGVTQGWKKDLILTGVGYNATLKGKDLVLVVGLSHEAVIKIPAGVTCKAEKVNVSLESADKDLIGNLASKIREVRPPEPYLGKGIRLSDEKIRRKAGKAGKK